MVGIVAANADMPVEAEGVGTEDFGAGRVIAGVGVEKDEIDVEEVGREDFEPPG